MQSPLKENELGISIILIPHNNKERFTTRMQRDVLPTVRAHPSWKFQMIFVDNSDEDKKQQYVFPEEDNIEYEYVWPGNNIMYGPAMNIAVSMCKYPYFVYICSNFWTKFPFLEPNQWTRSDKSMPLIHWFQ